jgi:hypothetical protein
MENTNFILYYSVNQDDTFNCFLPMNLTDSNDSNLLEHLQSSRKNETDIKLPLTKENYQFLVDLKVDGFEKLKSCDFFKEYKLEEWVL